MVLANIVSILIILGLVFFTAIYQLPIIAWTILIGIALLAITVMGTLAVIPLILCWLIYLATAGVANLKTLRIRHLIKPAFPRLQKQMPTISATEREAIEAGDTWWEKELFCGRPKWEKLFNVPKPTLTSEEQAFVDNQVAQLCGLVNDWYVVHRDHDLSPETWNYLKKEKFFGMVIPKQYGGLGFSALAHSTVVTKIASRSLSAAVSTMVPNSLGPAELLLHYGTEEQKNYYLPRLAAGDEIPCFALTAPDAGSDAGAIPDTGIVCHGQFEGKETLGIRLSWDKRYITLAPIATVLGVAFKLYDPDHLLGNKVNIGITLCLIPTNHPGVEMGHRHLPMYQAFMNGPTRGHDVFIPLDWIIGGEQMAGQGWRMLMECLSIGRSISLPALATGSSKVLYRITGAYARIRKQFNMPIASFEGVEEALGYIAGQAYQLEAARVMTAGAVDQKINPAIVSAIAKCHMTEMGRHGVSHAMDVQAGHAIQMGPDNSVANIYISMPISITVEGANILTRNLIIFGQGAIRCHPYLLKEVELITAAEPNYEELDRVLMSHVGFFMSNLLRSFAYGLTGGYFIRIKSKDRIMRKYKKQLVRMSAALALLADTSLILLGGSLKRRERLSARLGDIMSQLYLASTVLKYYHDQNKQKADKIYVAWCIQECLHKIQIACDGLFENYPYRWLGKLLSALVFPFGRAYPAPSDKLHRQVAESMLMPSELRDRLLAYAYISKQDNDLGNRLDRAIAQIADIEPIWKKLHKAVQKGEIPAYFAFAEQVQFAEEQGLISKEEATHVTEFETLRKQIIKVNEFSFDLTKVIA